MWASLGSGVCFWCITTGTLAVWVFVVVLVFVFKVLAFAEVG